jgi:hypothetical protein
MQPRCVPTDLFLVVPSVVDGVRERTLELLRNSLLDTKWDLGVALRAISCPNSVGLFARILSGGPGLADLVLQSIQAIRREV